MRNYNELSDEQLSCVIGGSAVSEPILAKILSRHLGISAGSISSSTNIVDDLGADSLEIVDIAAEIEEQFQISVADSQIANLKTFGDIVRYIDSLIY